MKPLLLLLLLVSPALAQDAIPFKVVDGRYVSVAVDITGPKGSVHVSDCWLDTAATELWLGRGYFQALGLPWDERQKHPQAFSSLRVGNLYYHQQATYGWSNVLSDYTCLIGMDRMWSWQTLFDFSRNLIIREPEVYWYQHWSACQTTVYQLWNRVYQCEGR